MIFLIRNTLNRTIFLVLNLTFMSNSAEKYELNITVGLTYLKIYYENSSYEEYFNSTELFEQKLLDIYITCPNENYQVLELIKIIQEYFLTL